MKPVELIRRCLANSAPAEGVVLDPFCGSGSTLVACELLGLRGYGVELDPGYCDVIIRRFEELTGQEARLLERPGDGPEPRAGDGVSGGGLQRRMPSTAAARTRPRSVRDW